MKLSIFLLFTGIVFSFFPKSVMIVSNNNSSLSKGIFQDFCNELEVAVKKIQENINKNQLGPSIFLNVQECPSCKLSQLNDIQSINQ
jgi:hypothetical protein